MPEHIVIVGGGQAAAQAVHTLRQGGFSGRVTLVGEEHHPPYQRPPLSKKYLAGELERERLYLRPAAFYADKGVELQLGSRADRIDPSTRQVALADGRKLEYHRLMLATGSCVRRLSAPGSDLNGIHYLRTIADVDAIRSSLRPNTRLVIVGAGYIGLEVASVARTLGADVTVLEMTDRVMARVVCPEISRFYSQVHAAAGVKIHCDTTVSSFVGRARVEAVETTAGERFGCDLAIVGIGVSPAQELAQRAGLPCDNGIVVDEHARTADPNIVAAGDCTSHPSRLAGRRVRLESVQNAIEQAKAAAQTLLGEPKAYTATPWFWSDQYELKLQIAGLSQGYDQVVIRGKAEEQRFAACYLRAGTLIAIDAVNSPKDFMVGKKLISAGAKVSAEVLADGSIDLATVAKELAPAESPGGVV